VQRGQAAQQVIERSAQPSKLPISALTQTTAGITPASPYWATASSGDEEIRSAGC
jgi:hypothetical protein